MNLKKLICPLLDQTKKLKTKYNGSLHIHNINSGNDSYSKTGTSFQLRNLIVAALYVLYVVSGETKFSVLGVHLSCRNKIQRTDRVTCIMLASVTPDAPPNMSVMALRSQLILLNSESTPENKTGFV